MRAGSPGSWPPRQSAGRGTWWRRRPPWCWTRCRVRAFLSFWTFSFLPLSVVFFFLFRLGSFFSPSPSFSLFPSPFRAPFPSVLSPPHSSPSPPSLLALTLQHRPPPRRPRLQGEGRDLGLYHGTGGHRARGRPRQLRLAEGRPGRLLTSERGQEEEREGAGALGV